MHISLGVIYAFFNPITIFLELIAFILGLYFAVTKGNSQIQFMQCLVYLVSIEIATRSQDILPHEFVKYGISILMIVYLLVNSKELKTEKYTWLALLYFFLLLPSLLIGEYDELEKPINVISFSLSGPISLAVSCSFFSRYTLTINNLLRVLSFALYPIILSLLYIIIKAPNIKDIEWALGANFESSAHMTGPNQISSIFGLGLFILFFTIYNKFYFSGYRFIDILFFGILLFRTILLFSRGGLISGFLAIITLYIFDILLKSKNASEKFNKIFQVIIFIVLSILLFNIVNDITNGTLYKRYRGEKANTEITGEIDYFSNREQIIDSDINIFLQNPIFGIGPGLGKHYRDKYLGWGASAHTELTRLLAEHGLLGILAAIIIIYLSIVSIKKNKKIGIPIVASLIVLSISTSFHAAMRLAMVGFIFGLSQLTIKSNSNKKNYV